MRYDDRLGYHAPIEYCPKNRGFYYTDPKYSAEKLPLGEEEIEMFEMMVESFQRFKGAQVLQHVEGVFDKLSKVYSSLLLTASQMKEMLYKSMTLYEA